MSLSIQERIEKLIYYGAYDEGSELFQQVCHLCYKAYGLNYTDEALYLCEWAEELAQGSLSEKDNYPSAIDQLQGHWGY